jgi:hypothetical protein
MTFEELDSVRQGWRMTPAMVQQLLGAARTTYGSWQVRGVPRYISAHVSTLLELERVNPKAFWRLSERRGVREPLRAIGGKS